VAGPPVTLFYSAEMAARHARVMRGVTGAVLNLTNRCNLKCRHCFNGSGPRAAASGEMDDAAVAGVVRQLADVKPFNVCFSGGEPLLRHGLLLRCAGLLAAAGVRTSIVTNGCLVTPRVAGDLAAAGVAEVEVSIDGARPETHERLRGVRGAFQAALDGIRCLVAAGVTTSISFTLTSWNGGDFGDVCRQGLALGVRAVLVRPMMPMGTAVRHLDGMMPSAAQYRALAREACELKWRGDGPEVWLTDVLSHIFTFRGQECVPCVEVKATGALIPTPYIQYSYGNVRRHTLAEYWDAGLYRAWRLPAVAQVASAMDSMAELTGAVARIPPLPPGRPSHCDLIDDAPGVWGGDGP
jgi:MoaA/NifB/PqqE/SkfB family radical SAM enzyme